METLCIVGWTAAIVALVVAIWKVRAHRRLVNSWNAKQRQWAIEKAELISRMDKRLLDRANTDGQLNIGRTVAHLLPQTGTAIIAEIKIRKRGSKRPDISLRYWTNLSSGYVTRKIANGWKEITVDDLIVIVEENQVPA